MAKMMVGRVKPAGGPPVGIAALGPDDSGGPAGLDAVGSAASAPKAAGGAGADLQEFTVKKGDDGGVVVCETNVASPPPGRRVGASFPQQGTYLETPYAPDASQDAMDHITDLLGQLGVAPSDEGTDQGETDTADQSAPPTGPPSMPPSGGGGGGFTGGY